MLKLFPIFWLIFTSGASATDSTGMPSLNTIMDVKDRIRSGDTSMITELESANTPASVFLLAHIVYLYRSYDAPQKYPGVWQAAAQSLARMPGACELLGAKLQEDTRAHRIRGNRPHFEVLRAVRSEEAVRVVGELLFDEYEVYDEVPQIDIERGVEMNAGFAKEVFRNWLYEYPEFEQKLGINELSAWQNWWNERKHDPATIRAIAEGRRPPDVVPPPPPPVPPEAPVPAPPVAPQQEPAAPSTSSSPEP